jgi:hypothetical protein
MTKEGTANEMKWIVLAFLLLTSMSTLPAFAAPPRFWSQRFGDAPAQLSQSVATDASGNVYLTGAFDGSVDFGGGGLSTAGSSDMFLVKFNSAGGHQWSQRFGDVASQKGNSVATDASGNVYVTGYFMGTINFGGANLVSAGSNDIFLVKFNSAGVHQWSKRFGDASDQQGFAVATDASGNVYMSGGFSGTVNFGGANLTGTLDTFLAKFNAAGVHQWSQRFGDVADDQECHSVATDISGNVYMAGFFAGTINFGGANLVSAGSNDIFVAKFNTSGVHQWSQRFGDASDQDGLGVATDASSNVYVTGAFAGTANFGGALLTSAADYDVFLVKFNSAGVHQWSERFGEWSAQVAYSVATDAAANVYVTGYFDGAVSFGGGFLTSAGALDIFLAKFNTAGVHQWSYRFGDGLGQSCYSLATDASANVYITGQFFGSVDFGAGPLTSAGSGDIFVAKFSGNSQPVISSIKDIGNDQGRKVKIRFAGSPFDDGGAPTPVAEYEVYRRDDVPPPSELNAPREGLSTRELQAIGWTYVGSAPAHQQPTYGIDVPTIGDSTIVHGLYRSVFFVRAATSSSGTFFDSPADSGYSVDNLAPGIPTSFAHNAGVLSWNSSAAADFDYFTVYGSATSAFGTATLINYTVGLNMNVSASPYVYYFVTATDFSGNEGKPAIVNALTGIGGTPRNYVLSISSYPNPFNPETTVRYTVPSKGRLRIEVYDAHGMRVTTLVDEEKAAGAYTQEWNARDDDGHAVSSGVYFVRLQFKGETRSAKLVLLK